MSDHDKVGASSDSADKKRQNQTGHSADKDKKRAEALRRNLKRRKAEKKKKSDKP